MSLSSRGVTLLLILAACTCLLALPVSAFTCPLPCQNGGVCTVKGVCACTTGYVGADCSRRGCASNCNRRGYCDLSSTPPSCLCFPGYDGNECEFVGPPVIVYVKNNNNNNTTSTTKTNTATATSSSSSTSSGSSATSSSTSTASSTTSGSATSSSTSSSSSSSSSSTSSSSSSSTNSNVYPLDRSICNPSCSSNGLCYKGVCACVEGFTGSTCSDKLCPDDCNNRGRCDKASGVCECYKPYTGPSCAGSSKPIVPRKVDTKEDVYGMDNVVSTKTAKGKSSVTVNSNTGRTVNVVNNNKKGVSSGFHLIEQASQVVDGIEEEY